LVFPGLFWFGKLLAVFGVPAIEDWYKIFPYFAVALLTIVVPIVMLLLGAFSCLHHTHTKRENLPISRLS